jgi:exopolysaccharide production protein ExoQ
MTIWAQRFAPHRGLLLLGGLVAGLSAVALAIEDYLSLALILGLPVVPVALSAGTRALRGDVVYALALAVVIIAVESANFRYREYADKTIDLQVALKLAGLVLLYLLSLPSILRCIRAGMPNAILLWLLFLTYLVFTSTYAVSPSYSLVASASMLGGFCYLLHVLEVYGRQRLLWVIALTSLILCLASIATYFAAPSFGRMSDWIGKAYIVTWRLQGVFGSSNAAGVSGAFALLIVTQFLPIRRQSPLFWLMLVAFVFCFLMSNNRMAIVAVVFAYGIVFLTRGNITGKSVLVLLAISTTVAGFLIAGDLLLESVTRSGSSEEVLSATGRTRIWAVVLELWQESPLFGYGYTSSQHILPSHPLLFVAAAHAHNMYLEVLFSSGLIGLALLVAGLLSTLWIALTRHAFKEAALIAFFALYGMTEPIFNSLVGFPAFAFFSAVLLVFARDTSVPADSDRETSILGSRRYRISSGLTR